MQMGDRVWRERGLRDAVLAGDATAWKTLYEESFAGLYAYVLWRCGGLRDSADEATQETWLTAVRCIARFDPVQGNFAGWLRGVAANVLRNHFRRRQRRDLRVLPLADEHPSRQDDAIRVQKAERVAAALNELPERCEAVLRAKYLDGRSVEDIAAVGGETIKAIESLLTRARQAFRDAYGSQEGCHE